MPIKVIEIHHHGVKICTGDESPEAVFDFYTNVLGLGHDPKRPDFPGVPGRWVNVGESGQIHLIGGPSPSPFAKSADQDPAGPHVALGVEDIVETKAELERMGVPHWTNVAGNTQQVFVRDPSGNMIELHQYDLCRCTAANRQALG